LQPIKSDFPFVNSSSGKLIPVPTGPRSSSSSTSSSTSPSTRKGPPCAPAAMRSVGRWHSHFFCAYREINFFGRSWYTWRRSGTYFRQNVYLNWVQDLWLLCSGVVPIPDLVLEHHIRAQAFQFSSKFTLILWSSQGNDVMGVRHWTAI